jgi:hypothetical protein
MASIKIELDNMDTTGAVFTMTLYESNTATSSGTFKCDVDKPTYLELLTKENLTLEGGNEL